MTRIVTIILCALLGVAFNTYAVEPKSGNTSDDQVVVNPSEGWKSVKSWKKLSEGMSYDEVIAILGKPQYVNGGGLITWYYRNGLALFTRGKLTRWEAPL